MSDATQWTLTVSRQTDEAVRELLIGDLTEQASDLSGFVEEAVKARIFELTVAEARRRVAHLSPDEIDRLVDEAVGWVRHA